MTDYEYPPFAEAIEEFRAFIIREGHSADLLWVYREDVMERWPRTYIKVPLSSDLAPVEQRYTEGLRRGLGLTIQVFCFLDGRPCCYIFLPEDEIDASYRMLSGLRFSVPAADLRTIVPVQSRLRWRWLNACNRFRPRRPPWSQDLPQRS